MKQITAVLIFCFWVSFGLAKVTEASPIKLSDDLSTYVEDIISAMPRKGENNYTAPSDDQMNSWEGMLLKLLAGDINTASTDATNLGYDLIEFTDTSAGDLFYLLRTAASSTNYWGTYILNPYPCRANLIIQSPHPIKDFHTGQQGLYVFQNIGARFFMLSGTDRCNSDDSSPCDGTTKVCSDDDTSEAYRISDMAHVDSSIFQRSTEVLFHYLADPYFIQLHGFAHNYDDGDPYVIMSNGTSEVPSLDYFPSLKTEILNQVDTLDTGDICIVHLDNPVSGDKCYALRAFSNTQGRYINGESNPCDDPASSTSGSFIHIEQEKEIFREDETGWSKIATALAHVFEVNCYPQNPINSGTYQECELLISSGSIPSGNTVTFKADTRIILKPEFQAQEGATFRAQLEACVIMSSEPPENIDAYFQDRSSSLAQPEPDLIIYPNPTSGTMINLRFQGIKSLGSIKIALYNSLGQLQMQQVTDLGGNFEHQMNLLNIPSGLYFLEVEVGSQVLVQKLNVQR